MDFKKIIKKAPKEIKEYFDKTNINFDNPLKSHKFNINFTYLKEVNEYNEIEITYYFKLSDIASLFDISIKGISERYKIKYKSIEELNGIIVPTKFKPNDLFISEKKISKVFSDNEDIIDHIDNFIVKTTKFIKYLDYVSKQQKVSDLEKTIENQQSKINNLEKITIQAFELYKNPERKPGIIYIASSPAMITSSLFKIGLTTNNRRESSLQTSNPDISMLVQLNTPDVLLTEKFIHQFLDHLRYKKEWFFLPSSKDAIKIVQTCVDCINNIFDNVDYAHKTLRENFIHNNMNYDMDILPDDIDVLMKSFDNELNTWMNKVNTEYKYIVSDKIDKEELKKIIIK